MSDRNLLWLVVAAAATFSVALILSVRSTPKPKAPTVPTALIQGLDPSSITKILIDDGDSSVTIQRRGETFVLADKSDYPASVKEINGLINTCMDIKTGNLKSSNSANHEEFEVTPEIADKVIEFQGADDKTLAGIVVGKSTTEPRQTYIRRVGSDEVYSVESVPYIRTQAMDYVDKRLADIEAADIVSAALTGPDFKYSLRRSGEDIALDPMPDGKQLKQYEPKNVLEVLATLECSDIEKEVPGLTFDHKYVAALKDSTVYTVQLGRKDDKSYVTVSSVVTDQSEVTINPNQQDSEEELKKKEALLLARDKAKAFNERHQGWVYELPSWRADNLTKKIDDLVEDLPEPEPVTEAAEVDAEMTPVPLRDDPNSP